MRKLPPKDVETSIVPATFSHIPLPSVPMIEPALTWHDSSENEATESVKNGSKYSEMLNAYALALYKNEIKLYKAKHNQDASGNKWVQTAASVGKYYLISLVILVYFENKRKKICINKIIC